MELFSGMVSRISPVVNSLHSHSSIMRFSAASFVAAVAATAVSTVSAACPQASRFGATIISPSTVSPGSVRTISYIDLIDFGILNLFSLYRP